MSQDREIEVPDISLGYIVGINVEGGLTFKVISEPGEKDKPQDVWALFGIAQVALKLVEGLVDEVMNVGTPSLKRAFVDVSRAQLEAYKAFSATQLGIMEAMIQKALGDKSKANITSLVTPPEVTHPAK
jgi:hypothetical protein